MMKMSAGIKINLKNNDYSAGIDKGGKQIEVAHIHKIIFS
jgi:hypothetical protein